MDLFRNGTDPTGTGQVPFTRRFFSEPFVFLSGPFQFFRSCKRALNYIQGFASILPLKLESWSVGDLRGFKVVGSLRVYKGRIRSQIIGLNFAPHFFPLF